MRIASIYSSGLLHMLSSHIIIRTYLVDALALANIVPFTIGSQRPKVQIFDTTLRDGEQGARQTLNPNQKAAIAKHMEKYVKVDVIDAGFPGSSKIDFDGAYRIAQETQKVKVSVLSYGTPLEIRAAAKALQPAEERSRISTFHRASEVEPRYSSREGIKKELLKKAKRSVLVASELAPEVQYYLIYSGNREPNFLVEMAHEVASAGATYVVVADSQSSMCTGEMYDLTREVVQAVEQYDTIVSAHCHNQLGLALPNTLAAISAGARQVETCLLGIGDAGGNLALEQLLAYKEHFYNRSQINTSNKNAYTTAFATQSDTSLVETVKLCKEVSECFGFNIGENQPIIGSRAFTCTTGIHQNNLNRVAHTAFNPELAGLQWRIAINRHSSRNTVRDALSKYDGSDKDEAYKALIDGMYSWVKGQYGEISDDSLRNHYDQYIKAYDTLVRGNVIIIPTTVGYTLASNHLGADKLKRLKGRPDGKPCGILGTPEIYERIFSESPPSKLPDTVCMGFLRCNVFGADSNDHDFLTDDCCGEGGKAGVWLNLGPIHKYLATRLWKERGEIIIASSCNMAGDGNPSGDSFSTSYLDPDVRSRASHVVDIPHWETPQFSDEGEWLSAPILDIDSGQIVRVGRDMDVARDCIKDFM